MKIGNEKIYSGWTFTDNEPEKCEQNAKVYNKYKHLKKSYDSKNPPTKEDLDNNIYIEYCGAGYKNMKYKVHTNIKCTDMFKAFMCDDGNLCFGYRFENGFIIIYTD